VRFCSEGFSVLGQARTRLCLEGQSLVLRATNLHVRRNNSSVQEGHYCTSSHNSDSQAVSITTKALRQFTGLAISAPVPNSAAGTLVNKLVELLNHSETWKLVKKTIYDCDRHKMNIIISGIPQSN